MERERQRPQPVIYIANHPHNEDRLYVLMALRTFRLATPSRGRGRKIPLFSSLMKLTDSINVDHGNTLEVLRSRLMEGQSVLIFPQGKTTKDRSTLVHSGAMVLSLQTGVPIVPLFIKDRFQVKVGEP